MAIYFWDASALIKHYRQKSGAEYVDRLLAEVGAEHFISRLGRVEILSTHTRLARTEEITQKDFQATYADAFEQGLLGRHLGIVAMTEAVYQTAERLFLDHGRHRRLRVLDALNLGACLKLQEQRPLEAFVSADEDVCDVA